MRFNHVSLSVADVARAQAFYEGLGLAAIVVDRDPDGAVRYVRLVFPQGDATLSLERGTPTPGGSTILYFECDDLEQRVRRLDDQGQSLKIETQPWLWREAHLHDPDGHRLCLYQAGSYRLDPPWRVPGSPSPLPEPVLPPAADPLSRFTWAQNRGYADAGIPSARDAEIARFVDGLAAATNEDREVAAERLDSTTTRVFITFAERAATLAVRRQEAGWVLRGLLALSLVWRHAVDVRPAIPVLGLLYDAAGRAGGLATDIFQRAAELAPGDVSPLFHDFLTRGDLDDILDEMGYQVGTDGQGFRYRRLWGEGKLDLDENGGGERPPLASPDDEDGWSG